MPSVFIPTPQFPNVPILPGVPPLLIAPNAIAAALPALAFADALGIGSLFGQSQWGIFDQTGGVILESDSTFAVEYVRDYHISDYPQEQGAFQSYNKVQLPYQAKVTFVITGTRFAFLNSIEAAVNSLDLFVVVTPEIQYANANLTHYGYRREARAGVTLITVDVWCEEIRTPTTTTFGNTPTQAATSTTQSPNAATTTQDGTVQAQTTTPAADGGAPYTFTIPTQNPGPNATVSQGGTVSTSSTNSTVSATSQGGVNTTTFPEGTNSDAATQGGINTTPPRTDSLTTFDVPQ
jgi:hypothetical protein